MDRLLRTKSRGGQVTGRDLCPDREDYDDAEDWLLAGLAWAMEDLRNGH